MNHKSISNKQLNGGKSFGEIKSPRCTLNSLHFVESDD